MKSRDFCYWLQGYFEIHGQTWDKPTLDTKQVETIRRHLTMVFKHEIDPEAGSSEHQDSLNSTHEAADGSFLMRC